MTSQGCLDMAEKVLLDHGDIELAAAWMELAERRLKWENQPSWSPPKAPPRMSQL